MVKHIITISLLLSAAPSFAMNKVNVDAWLKAKLAAEATLETTKQKNALQRSQEELSYFNQKNAELKKKYTEQGDLWISGGVYALLGSFAWGGSVAITRAGLGLTSLLIKRNLSSYFPVRFWLSVPGSLAMGLGATLVSINRAVKNDKLARSIPTYAGEDELNAFKSLDYENRLKKFWQSK